MSDFKKQTNCPESLNECIILQEEKCTDSRGTREYKFLVIKQGTSSSIVESGATLEKVLELMSADEHLENLKFINPRESKKEPCAKLLKNLGKKNK
jgi:hypothetical protein